jgi:phospholipid/cholesterol/gamma-HCH transport system ATP-binding protein
MNQSATQKKLATPAAPEHSTEERKKVIEVRDLVTHYGTRKILDGVNLTVSQGEIVVIMGGSGSGKTTLLNHLLGLLIPTSGTIELLGLDITQAGADEMLALRRNMGMAFQSGALFSSMTVSENIQMPMREHTSMRQSTMEILAQMKLEIVNMGGFENLMPAELSGGMTKRVALARAIALDPDLLFFDEPSAGLDPVVAAELDELIVDLRNALNMSMVIVTHELESAFRIADRIVVLDKGKIVFAGSVEEIKQSTQERVVALINRQSNEDNENNNDAFIERLLN